MKYQKKKSNIELQGTYKSYKKNEIKLKTK